MELDITKTCSKCGEQKPASSEYFHKAMSVACGLFSACKVCRKEEDRLRYEANKESIRAKQRIYVENNKGKELMRQKIWAQANPEKVRAKAKRSYEKHHTQRRRRHNATRRSRSVSDPSYRIQCSLRVRMKDAIKHKRNRSSLELLGCSIDVVCLHIESLFKEEMTWENYGEWHIDHIRPCASFDLGDKDQQKRCFHYTNLQPLWALENMSKGAKWGDGI